jgi:cell division protein FtsW
MNWLISRTKGDLVIWGVVLVLSLISLLAVYSSTGTMAYKYQSGNTEYYLLKHFGLMLFGLVVMYYSHLINYKYYSRIAQLMLYVSVPLLIVTYAVGTNVNQAVRWITLPGLGLTFQTSDFAKLALIMSTARLLAKKQDVINDFRQGTLPVILPILIVCALIAPSNLSTAALLFVTCCMVMFVGRANVKHILLISLGLAVFAITIITALHLAGQASGNPYGRVETWVSRVDHYIHGDAQDNENFQSTQAQIAIATGGIIGKGPGNSVQKNFLPNPYADFIFAIIVEEYGLIGASFLIMLYLLFLYRSIQIVVKSPRAFGALLAVGLSFSLVFQALINMCVATNLLPVTGLTLPLVSMGGTSLWFTSLSFGIILSVSRDIEANENLELATQ